LQIFAAKTQIFILNKLLSVKISLKYFGCTWQIDFGGQTKKIPQVLSETSGMKIKRATAKFKKKWWEKI
jgi:hypothetical protein